MGAGRLAAESPVTGPTQCFLHGEMKPDQVDEAANSLKLMTCPADRRLLGGVGQVSLLPRLSLIAEN